MDIIKTATELACLVSEKNLGSITVKDGDIEISVEAKCAGNAPTTTAYHHSAPTMTNSQGGGQLESQLAANTVAVESVAVESVAVESAKEKRYGNYITSPIVGTFYSASAPEKPPFVKIGDKVIKGQVVCIVESMKLMNEINSDFDGTVVAILAFDGEAVDFGKELIEII